jgi:hypothetical protein
MCNVLLPSGVNLTAVNKSININIFLAIENIKQLLYNTVHTVDVFMVCYICYIFYLLWDKAVYVFCFWYFMEMVKDKAEHVGVFYTLKM